VVHTHHFRGLPACRLLAWSLLATATGAQAADLGGGLTAGGTLTLTSDYIYRGLSESDGHGAAQADVHIDSAAGTFLGVWASTRDRNLQPGTDYEVEAYLGQRFDLGSTWSASVDGRAHYYVGGMQYTSLDYQEVSASLTYLDRWSLSLTAIPNAVRYSYTQRLSRGLAWVADTSGQWLLAHGLFGTAGAGYYYANGRTTQLPTEYLAPPLPSGAGGYAYGNVGLAYEYRHWRLDVGYFLTQRRAQEVVAPYPLANHRFAATVSWRF